MIAELFYTKRLMAVIIDLRKKGCLNENALKNIDYEIRRSFFIMIFCLFFLSLLLIGANFVVGGAESVLFTVIIGGICFFSIVAGFFEKRAKVCNKFAVLLTVGNRTKGTVERFWAYSFSLDRPIWMCSYHFIPEGGHRNRVISGRCKLLPNITKTSLVAGEKVSIAYDPEEPNLNVPVIPEIETRFNLNK